MTTAAVVVERELVRASRRWQTYAQRSVFALVMFGFVVVYWDQNISGKTWAPSSLSRAGRQISEAWAWMQFGLLAMMTPVVVAQAIVEEKTAGTLELLTTTRLTPRRILLGKIASRLLVLEGLMLVGLPVIALCVSLGGVEPMALVNGLLQSTAVIVGMGAVAAFLALYANGPIGPAVLTWIWAFGAWFPGVLPMTFVGGTIHGDLTQAISPVAALSIADNWTIVGPLLLHLVVAAAALVLAGRVWTAMASSDNPEDEDLSAGLWAVEGIKKKTGLLLAVLALSLPGMLFTETITQRSSLRGWFLLGLWLWNVAFVLGFTLLWLLICRAGFRYASRKVGGRRRSWRRMAEFWAGGRALPHAARPVWGNPVAWREWRTAAHGVVSRWLVRGYCLLGLFLILRFATIPPEDYSWRADDIVSWAFLGFFACGVGTVFLATSSIAGEQRRRTMDLMRVTAMTTAAVLRGKLIAVALLIGPLVAMSSVVLVPGMLEWADEWLVAAGRRTQASDLMQHWAAICLWGVSALTFLAVSCQAIALRAGTSGRAWVATMTWAVALVLAPIFLRVVSQRRWGDVRDVVGFLNPGLNESFWRQAEISWPIVASAAFWFVLSGFVFFLSARRFGVDRS
jgi:ABC-type transport system involved in multi-copper enzyme maturation permease subunit